MITISIHCFPHEIDNYVRVIKNLNECALHTNDKDNVEILSCMNTNESLVDWGGASPAEIEQVNTTFRTTSEQSIIKCTESITNSVNFLGVNEHRRNTIDRASSTDIIIFLDCDLHFNRNILGHLELATTKISNFLDDYIITPNTVRLWDKTWDSIVHPDYLSHPLGMFKTINPTEVVDRDYGDVKLTPNFTFKWGGGWFNAISASLLKRVHIPKSFRGYGPDDTFIMECCKILKRKGHRVQQYILNNVVVCEDRNIPKGTMSLKADIPNFREQSTEKFHTELNNFLRKL